MIVSATNVPGLIRGRDGWLFLDDSHHAVLSQHTGKRLLDADALALWRSVLERRCEWIAGIGSHAALLITPNAHTICADRLPDGYPIAESRTVTQVISAAPKAMTVCFPVEDLRDADRAGRDPYWCGGSYWAPTGAFTAYRALLASLPARAGRAPRILDWSDVEITETTIVGDLAHRLPERPAFPAKLCALQRRTSRDLYNNQLPPRGRVHVLVGADPDLPTCCWFGDALSETMVAFLAESFSRLVFVHRPGIDPELVARERPDYVVQQIAERHLIEPIDDALELRTDELVVERILALEPDQRVAALTRLAQQVESGWAAPEPQLHLAAALLATGDGVGAQSAAEIACEIAPEWPAAHLVRSQALARQNLSEASLAARRQADEAIAGIALSNRYPKPVRPPAARRAETALAAIAEQPRRPAPAPLTWRARLHALRWPLALIAGPTVLCLLFWGVIASPRYVGSSQFQVTNQSSPSISGPLQFLGLANNTGSNDTRLAFHYLRSADLLAKLDADLALKEHYQQGGIDPISRLSRSATSEEFLRYYQDHLSTSFDDAAGLVTFEIQGFAPDFAQRLADDMLTRSEDYLNEVGHQLARERLVFFKDELRRSTAKLDEAKTAMIAFQNQHGILDPMAEAGGRTATVLKLEDSLAEQRADLTALLAVQGPSSGEVAALKSRIVGLESLIRDERARIIGAPANLGKGTDPGTINAIVAEWSALELEVDFATQLVKASTSSLEQAQTEVGQKIKSLVVVSRPLLAQEATYPRAWYNTITLLIACLLIYGTGVMILATIREHRD